nr:uncharacterized protein LOC128704524 [Cherax quadricarinatus]
MLTQLPREATDLFGSLLLPHMYGILQSDASTAFEEQSFTHKVHGHASWPAEVRERNYLKTFTASPSHQEKMHQHGGNSTSLVHPRDSSCPCKFRCNAHEFKPIMQIWPGGIRGSNLQTHTTSKLLPGEIKISSILSFTIIQTSCMFMDGNTILAPINAHTRAYARQQRSEASLFFTVTAALSTASSSQPASQLQGCLSSLGRGEKKPEISSIFLYFYW